MVVARGLRPRNLRRAIVAGGFAVAVLLSLVAAAAWTLAGSTPSWWRGMRPADPAVMQRAERLENAATAEFTRVRVAAVGDGESPGGDGGYRSEPWAVSISDADASAWMAARLPRWLEEIDGAPSWPAELSELQMRFEPGMTRLGVRYDGPRGGGRVLSIALRPQVDASGAVWLVAESVQLGRLPLPAQWVLGGAREAPEDVLPEELALFDLTTAVLDIARGVTPAAVEPVMELPDRRRVRLLGVTVKAGAIELVCRTEKMVTRAERE